MLPSLLSVFASSLDVGLAVGLAVALVSVLVMSLLSLLPSLLCSPAVALAPVCAMSLTGGGLACIPLNISQRWRTPSRLLFVYSLLRIRLNVCCLLYIRLNVYPLPP